VADLSAIVIPNLVINHITVPWSKFSDFTWEVFLAVLKTTALCGAALGFGLMPGPSAGIYWPPFNPQVYGPEISLHFTDPYTILHFEDGIIAYLLWGWWGWDSSPFPTTNEFRTHWNDIGGMLLGLLGGYLFEVVENSDHVINQLKRDHGPSQFYQGDSRLNAFGDILFLGVGYSLTKVCFAYGLGWFPIMLLIFLEIFSALTFRDNLTFTTIQILHPMQWIKDYQNELVPTHLKGVMRVGYWENKIRDSPEEFLDRLVKNKSIQYSQFSSLSHRDIGVSKGYMRYLNKVIKRY